MRHSFRGIIDRVLLLILEEGGTDRVTQVAKILLRIGHIRSHRAECLEHATSVKPRKPDDDCQTAAQTMRRVVTAVKETLTLSCRYRLLLGDQRCTVSTRLSLASMWPDFNSWVLLSRFLAKSNKI